MGFKGYVFLVGVAMLPLASCQSASDGVTTLSNLSTDPNLVTPLQPSTWSFDVAGVASVSGPLAGASVSAYKLRGDGSLGDLLAQATTDSQGNFAMSHISFQGPIAFVAQNGQFDELGGAHASVSMSGRQVRCYLRSAADDIAYLGINPTDAGSSVLPIAVNPFTEMAAQAADSLYSSQSYPNSTYGALVQGADDLISQSLGTNFFILESSVPAPSNQAVSDPTSTNAQMLAALGALSEQAVSYGATTYDLMIGYGEDVAADQTFDGLGDGGVQITVGTENLDSTTWPDLQNQSANFVGGSDNVMSLTSDSELIDMTSSPSFEAPDNEASDFCI